MRWLTMQNNIELTAKLCGTDYKLSKNQEERTVIKTRAGRNGFMASELRLGFANQL